MPSTSETVLQAFLAAITAGAPVGALVGRNTALAERIPDAGTMILWDGDPGDPDALLSPTRYIYEHRAEVEIAVQAKTEALCDAAFDTLKLALAAAIDADRTLGGLCDYVVGEAPIPEDIDFSGTLPTKAATVGVLLIYETSDPLT